MGALLDDYDYYAELSSKKSVRKEMERTYTAEDIIDYLQRRAKLLGRTPTSSDINLDKDGPGKSGILKVFLSYPDAVEAAGLEPLRKPWRLWGDDELIELLEEWYTNHPGVVVTYAMMRLSDELPSKEIIQKRFGDIEKWHRIAGINYESPKNNFWRGT